MEVVPRNCRRGQVRRGACAQFRQNDHSSPADFTTASADGFATQFVGVQLDCVVVDVTFSVVIPGFHFLVLSSSGRGD
jgi:hypothetical protein